MTHTSSPWRWITCAETAKLIRTALKDAFPGVKFSVRSDTYSGGASIRVRWTDGPSRSAVKAICDKYEGSRFDGMIDLAYSAQHNLCPVHGVSVSRVYGHGMGNDAEFGPCCDQAEAVHFGADYVFEERNVSPEIAEAAQAKVAAKWGEPFDPYDHWHSQMYREEVGDL